LTDPAELRPDYLLVRRPHFHLRGNSLFWVASQTPRRQLSEPEIELWNLIQQPVSVNDARAACGEDADAMIREYLRSEYCELVEPAFASGRRRVLVIEPHADDAVLSIGGTMWLRRHECAFSIATMASRTNHTRYRDLGCDYSDIEEVTELRRRESELIARMIGGDHVSVGMTDAALRYRDANWTSDFFRRHRMSVRIVTSRTADNRDRQQWEDAVRRLLTEYPSAEVWFPLGGPHTDHMLTADACFAAFLSNPSLVAGRVLRVYPESPYAARSRHHMDTALEALRNSGAVLKEELVWIDTASDQKRRLASIYDSQDIEEMRADTEASELMRGSAGRSELLWTLKALPEHIDPSGIVSAAMAEHEQEEAIMAWLVKNKKEERLRVLLSMPTGQWATDLEALCVAFPRATFEVYVAPAAEAEVADVPSDRVVVRKVASGALAWIFISLQFSVMMKSLPTLFHAGHRRLRQARILSRLWPGSDTLIVASMDPLVRVLRARRQ
jgi:LmbE family N-acetylglucosaminyl deacetylase